MMRIYFKQACTVFKGDKTSQTLSVGKDEYLSGVMCIVSRCKPFVFVQTTTEDYVINREHIDKIIIE